MLRRPPRATRTYTLFPSTSLFRSGRVDRVGEHQCDEQHRAFVAHIARSARRDLPALVEQRAEMAELRLLAVAAGNDMRAIADGERDFGHQPRSSRAITSSSAWTASALRDSSEEGRVGKGGYRTCKTRWSPYH